MDFPASFDAVAGVVRSIPRSELLMAALAAMVLGWAGSLLLRRGKRFGHALRTASSLGLAAVLVLVVLQLSRIDPRFDVAVPELGLPDQVVEGGETRVPLGPDGHFWLRASVNGVEGNFMVDTGATITAISQGLADRAGLVPRRGGIPIMISTANGTVAAKVAPVGTLAFGNIEAHGIDAVVAPNFGETNVLGMNVLARLDGWRVEKNELVLTPAASDRKQ